MQVRERKRESKLTWIEHLVFWDVKVSEDAVVARMAVVSSLKAQPLGVDSESSREDVLSTNIAMMGASVVAPAQVDPNHVSWNVGQGRVEYSDMHLDHCLPGDEAEVLELGVPRHGKIWAVNLCWKKGRKAGLENERMQVRAREREQTYLQRKSTVNYGAVLLCECLANSLHVGRVSGVNAGRVALEKHCHRPGGWHRPEGLPRQTSVVREQCLLDLEKILL